MSRESTERVKAMFCRGPDDEFLPPVSYCYIHEDFVFLFLMAAQDEVDSQIVESLKDC